MALTAEQLEAEALKAKRLRTAAGEREAHSIKDLIALDEHLTGKSASSSSSLPVRLAKIRSGGSTTCRE